MPKVSPSNFDPEMVSMMRSVLDAAVDQIDRGNRTPATKAKMAEQSALENQLAELKETKRVAEAGISCNIAAVGGELHIRTLPLKPDTPSLFDTPPKELKVKLRGTNSVGEMLFAGSSGTFQWQYSSPQDANA